MTYRDYCVSVLDKVWSAFRTDIKHPCLEHKDIERDALFFGYKDNADPITLEHPALPEELQLWEEVTKPGNYFDPQLRGFHYIEVYNPEYWMEYNNLIAQSCFHPMYRMRTRNTRSCLNNTVIAFWSTKYANVIAEAPGAVAAPSIHFGFPLWFFNRQQAQAIADEIFDVWQIKLVERNR